MPIRREGKGGGLLQPKKNDYPSIWLLVFLDSRARRRFIGDFVGRDWWRAAGFRGSYVALVLFQSNKVIFGMDQERMRKLVKKNRAEDTGETRALDFNFENGIADIVLAGKREHCERGERNVGRRTKRRTPSTRRRDCGAVSWVVCS